MSDFDDNTLFPETFPDVGGKTFVYTYENRPEFVKFTLTEMNKPTQFFLVWKNYCMRKTKDDNGI